MYKDQEQHLISICKLVQQQNIITLECECHENIHYYFALMDNYIEVCVKQQKKKGTMYIDYKEFYHVDYEKFEMKYIDI
jgi:hypothetical protein